MFENFRFICHIFLACCILQQNGDLFYFRFCSRNTLLWKDFSCFRRLILSLSWKSNDQGGLKFWTCLHATLLLAVKYSRTVKCPSPLKRLGIFVSPFNRYFSQITLTNRIYLNKIYMANPVSALDNMIGDY